MAGLAFEKVTKRFDAMVAVDGLDLEVHDGELLVLLGPSGCGKTTALRMVAGLEDVTEGTIRIGERVVNDIEPKDRDVAMVFQSYALYPHLTVAKNIEFPLRQRHVERSERERKVREAAATLGLGDLLDRRPAQLSGGQRQRVALARAIVRSPLAFLMDEPLSNLDATLRTQTRADIVTLQQKLGTTTLYVTHDQVEAMTMGDRIAVMSAGVLQQVGAPQDIYSTPVNLFVAGFIGNPGMNLVAGAVEQGPTGPAVRVESGSVPLPARFGAPGASGVVVGFRPEAVRIDPAGTLGATVNIVELLGADVHVVCHVDDTRVIVRQDVTQRRPEIGERIKLSVEAEGVHVFDAASGERLRSQGAVTTGTAAPTRVAVPGAPANAFERKRWNDEAWTRAWLKREVITASVLPIFLEHVSVAPGDRVLEVGSGTGNLAIELARRVLPGGSVLGADLSAPLVEVARDKAVRAGLSDVRFSVLDAQTAVFEGAPFDAALSQFGVMFFDDPVAAFTNIARQLSPRARLTFVCWQDLEANPWCVSPLLLRYLGPAPPPPTADGVPPGPFAFGNPDRVRSILRASGFGDIERTPYERTAVVAREVLFDPSLLEPIEPGDRPEANLAVEQRLAPFARSDQELEVPLAFQVFSARRT